MDNAALKLIPANVETVLGETIAMHSLDYPGPRDRLDIVVDLDGILNDLFRYWLNQYEIDTGQHLDRESFKQWDLGTYLPDNGKLLYTYMDKPGFYKYAPPVKPAIDAVESFVRDGHRVIVYTACDNTPQAYYEKALWINHHLPYLPNKNKIIGGNFKHRFEADVLIDDSPKNMQAYKACHPEAKVIGIRYPYNANVKGIDLLANDYEHPEQAWAEIRQYIGGLRLH